VLIRSLPPIPTVGLTSDDIPALMQACQTQMDGCIAAMDRELQSAATIELASR
ncbi:MAG: 1-acyl-sn-glycerol-3-phosphate acyltransferase, partial [Proteobacteria bacterium]